jgi:hypothetical protein
LRNTGSDRDGWRGVAFPTKRRGAIREEGACPVDEIGGQVQRDHLREEEVVVNIIIGSRDIKECSRGEVFARPSIMNIINESKCCHVAAHMRAKAKMLRWEEVVGFEVMLETCIDSFFEEFCKSVKECDRTVASWRGIRGFVWFGENKSNALLEQIGLCIGSEDIVEQRCDKMLERGPGLHPKKVRESIRSGGFIGINAAEVLIYFSSGDEWEVRKWWKKRRRVILSNGREELCREGREFLLISMSNSSSGV